MVSKHQRNTENFLVKTFILYIKYGFKDNGIGRKYRYNEENKLLETSSRKP
jgi:hypothetical protein